VIEGTSGGLCKNRISMIDLIFLFGVTLTTIKQLQNQSNIYGLDCISKSKQGEKNAAGKDSKSMLCPGCGGT